VDARHGARSVAFPSISTGIYGYPVERAARVALRAVAAELAVKPLAEVRFVLFSDADFRAYTAALAEVCPAGGSPPPAK
jgi:O-acetyl-ADP-ribose deacetylase (regulator of RNase III)